MIKIYDTNDSYVALKLVGVLSLSLLLRDSSLPLGSLIDASSHVSHLCHKDRAELI